MQMMEKWSLFRIVGIVALALGGFCGLFGGIALAAAFIRPASTPPPPVSGAPTQTESALHTKTPTGVEGATPTASGIDLPASVSPTPLLVITTTPITTTLLLTNTVPVTSTVTPTPIHMVGGMDGWCIPWNSQTTNAQVIRAIDGITIQVRLAGELRLVRYIGIAMPEISPDSLEWEAIVERNQMLVEGKNILLIKDRSEADEADRLLRYVIADGIFVNRELVESGYAIAKSQPPDTSCDDTFAEAQSLALSAQRGVWAPTATLVPTRYIPTATSTPPSTGDVIITFIDFKGTPWEEPDEFVEIKNNSSVPVQMEGWTLQNNQGHKFAFPYFLMRPGWYCRIYTNEYHPGSCGFSFNRPSPVWDDDTDCATLKDSDGNLVDQFCYD